MRCWLRTRLPQQREDRGNAHMSFILGDGSTAGILKGKIDGLFVRVTEAPGGSLDASNVRNTQRHRQTAKMQHLQE